MTCDTWHVVTLVGRKAMFRYNMGIISFAIKLDYPRITLGIRECGKLHNSSVKWSKTRNSIFKRPMTFCKEIHFSDCCWNVLINNKLLEYFCRSSPRHSSTLGQKTYKTLAILGNGDLPNGKTRFSLILISVISPNRIYYS